MQTFISNQVGRTFILVHHRFRLEFIPSVAIDILSA